MAAAESNGDETPETQAIDPAVRNFPEDLTALFRVGKAECDVSLTKTHIKWDKPARKDKTIFSNSLVIADILAVKEVPAGKTGSNIYGFCVHHVTQNSKTYIWKVVTTNFQTQDEALSKTWTSSLQQHLATIVAENKRPQNLMILINPMSGDHHAGKLYEKHCAPLFRLTGIKTNVTVTESGQHMIDLLSQCDLTGVDGVILAGGDGTVSIGINSILKRYMKEAGKDINNADEELVSCPITFGVLPTGSGNGMAKMGASGTTDIPTAALHIIMGNLVPMEVMSVFNDGKLLDYSTLLLSYGVYGEMMKYAESHKDMGKKRYLIATFKALTTFSKLYDFDILYLPGDNMQGDSRNTSDEPVGTDGWYKAAGPFGNLFMTTGNVETGEPMNGSCSAHLFTRVARMGILQMTYRMQTKKTNCYDFDFMRNIEAKMFKIVNRSPKSETGASAESGPTAQTWNVNIDGDPHDISNPETLIKFPMTTFKLFGTGPWMKELREKTKKDLSGDRK